MDEKQQQFITEVQTALVIDSLRKDRSATSALIIMDDAYYAAERIPSELGAHQAAVEFCEHFLDAQGSIKGWFTRF